MDKRTTYNQNNNNNDNNILFINKQYLLNNNIIISQQPTQQEINTCITQIENYISEEHIVQIIETLYHRLIAQHNNQDRGFISKSIDQQIEIEIDQQKDKNKDKDYSIIGQINEDNISEPQQSQKQSKQKIHDKQLQQQQRQRQKKVPKFQIRQILPKPKPKRQKQDREWLQDKPETDKNKIISGQIWDRYRFKQDKSDKQSTFIKGNAIQILDNLNRSQSWNYSLQNNKQHRLYANKIAPRFNNKDQQHKFYEKRNTAKSFCQKTYQKIKQQLQQKSQAPPSLSQTNLNLNLNKPNSKTISNLNPNFPNHNHNNNKLNNRYRYSNYYKNVRSNYSYSDKKRYKVISIAFITEAFRKFQIFIMQNIDKKIRPLTGPQIRQLYSILLNAQHYFNQKQFNTFRKFIKIAFDLGSISVYELQAKLLYRCIQECLICKIKEIKNKNQNRDDDVVDDWMIPWVEEEEFIKMYPYLDNSNRCEEICLEGVEEEGKQLKQEGLSLQSPMYFEL